AEYERLRGLDSVTDAEIADLIARIEALEAIVADIESERPGTGTDTPGVGGDSDNETPDSDGAAEAEDDEEEDKLPPTGETNYLMVSIIGLVFIGSGVTLAFTFKKDERTE